MKRRTFIKAALATATATPIAAMGNHKVTAGNVHVPFLDHGSNDGRVFFAETTTMPDKTLKCIEASQIAHSAAYLLRDGQVIRGDCIAPVGQLRVNWQDGAGWQRIDAGYINPLVLGRVLEVQERSAGD